MTIRHSSLGLGSTIPVGGSAGERGQSAYEVWLAAGNTGSVSAFLASLRGSPATVNNKTGAIITLVASDVGAAASGANTDLISITGLAGPVQNSYTSTASGILYGYSVNVKGGGAATDYIVATQFNAYNVGSKTRPVFGSATEAWSGDAMTAPAIDSVLIGAEPAVIQQYDYTNQATVGADLPFKNRSDLEAVTKLGLGRNGYNRNSRALQISAQARSSAGEYCGWSAGIFFTAASLDRTVDGFAVGIDMSAVDSTRLASAFRMPPNGKITWDGDARAVGISSGSFVYTVSGATPLAVDSAGNLAATGTVKPGAYTVATLPTPGTKGRIAFAVDARVSGQAAGAGTGSLVTDSGAAWQIAGTATTAAA